MKDLHEIERALEKSSRDLLFGDTNPVLRTALLGAIRNVSDAYIVNWVPEQASDIYTVIIPPDKRVVVELPRRGLEQEQEVTIEIKKYDDTALNAKGTSREKRDKLLAVKSLMAKYRAGDVTPKPLINSQPPAPR